MAEVAGAGEVGSRALLVGSRSQPPVPRGYAMAALLVGMSVMAVMLGAALPVWQTALRRERETELVFRGEQYVQAISLFQRRYAGTFPPNIDVLVEQRFLRRRYRDPITGGDFRLLYAAEDAASALARTQPVARRRLWCRRPVRLRTRRPRRHSTGAGASLASSARARAPSLRLFNGRGRYNEWTFVVTRAETQAAAPPRAAAIRPLPPPPDPALLSRPR